MLIRLIVSFFPTGFYFIFNEFLFVCLFVLLHPFASFTQPPNTAPHLTAVSLFSVTLSQFLFCLLDNFVH